MCLFPKPAFPNSSLSGDWKLVLKFGKRGTQHRLSR